MAVDYNKVFPETISQGVVGGPEFLTDITELRSGAEERNTPWSDPLFVYNAGLGIRDRVGLQEFQNFSLAVRGMLKSFRFKDWSDYRSCGPQDKGISPKDQHLGQGDGTTYFFRLYKVYGDYSRRITNPRVLSVIVAFNGVEQDSESFFVDDQNGVVVFLTPPPSGVVITCGFEFDVPVRFNSDYIPTQLKLFDLGSVPDIPIREIRVVENIVESDYQKAIDFLKVYSKKELKGLSNMYDYTVNIHWGGFWEDHLWPVTT